MQFWVQLAFLVSGALWGFLENFLFWLLEDLGSTKFLMGMSQAVGTLATLPLTIFSGKIHYHNEECHPTKGQQTCSFYCGKECNNMKYYDPVFNGDSK